jgi:hypothetical protein
MSTRAHPLLFKSPIPSLSNIQPILPRFNPPAKAVRSVSRRSKKVWIVTFVTGGLFIWSILDRWIKLSRSAISGNDEILVADNIGSEAVVKHTASRRWAPIILENPLDNMPTHFAPFIAASIGNTDDIYGEELLYPDFAIPMPIFAEDEHRRRWMSGTKGISQRATLVDGQDFFQYKGQHGQNFASRFSPVPVSHNGKLINRGHRADPDKHQLYTSDII